ncbi:DUF4180 domain-containing protein [Paenibacillus allorhizosphaerae]|uniref:DUF4180 domain-containing protein n=1 Tax=Paenibacillus allorhizosphaerae TaxID=2849866 RepID=A0ABM8VR49_9BACL|nr:DUF4180 domain-containing protein [Paenibacillus allorhizosphaerae]CAG7654860.1 hypothetical protein PAECIP111802_05912 [Paenibacillus allorhizosphaerae]
MNIAKVEAGGSNIAVVSGSEIVISDVQSALDLMATVQYEADSDRIVIHKNMISERFFDLKTRLAGEILQKFINYRVKVAFVGDFSEYSSRSFQDFVYECNSGRDIFFLPTEQQAIDKLSMLKQ